MVEPDEDAKPVIGEQAEKEGETELAEGGGAPAASVAMATPDRIAPSWLYQVGSGDWRRNELMIGAIHSPQRSTRTPCSTRPSTPLGLTSVLIGLKLRCSAASSST